MHRFHSAGGRESNGCPQRVEHGSPEPSLLPTTAMSFAKEIEQKGLKGGLGSWVYKSYQPQNMWQYRGDRSQFTIDLMRLIVSGRFLKTYVGLSRLPRDGRIFPLEFSRSQWIFLLIAEPFL